MTDEAFPDALPVGYRLHWYLLEQVLGQGGFGITYLARDTNLDRLVAIKEYLPCDIARRRSDAAAHPRTEAQAERYQWGLERFLAEAKTLARFDHPNIVRVNSVFEANCTAYMVMRFEEGESLAQLLERHGTLTERQLLNGLLPILDGLQLVHSAGYIHRDIKPDNIYLRQDGSAVLLDFGSARQAFGHSKSMTVLVAPGYAPLEQYYSDAATQGAWTDIYSLGATCYRAIAGRAPMDAIARAKGVLGSAREVLPPAVEVGRGRYSERMLAAVDHALQLQERDRPQTIAEWRREFDPVSAVPEPSTSAFAPQVSTPVAPEVDAPASAATPALQPAQLAATEPPGREPRRANGPIAAAVVALAVVAVPFLAFRAPDRASPTTSPVPPATHPNGVANAAELAAPLAPAALAPPPNPAPGPAWVAQDPVALTSGAAHEVPRLPNAPRAETRSVAVVATAPLVSGPVTPAAPAVRMPAAAVTPPVLAAVAKPPPAPAPEPVPSPVVGESNAPVPVPVPVPVQAPAPVPAPMQAPVPAPAQSLALAAPPREPAPAVLRTDPIDAAEAALQRGDRTQAVRLLTPWADAGSTRAQLLLAKSQEARADRDGSDFQAYIWYAIAARRGESGASALRDRVGARLQPVEIKQADRVVERWRPGPEPAAKANP